MKYSEQSLQTFRLRNFKAVRDSGVVKFTPLTVFIGNNGSGKSSLLEGLETFQAIVTDGLDEAMNRWRGFENVLNKSVPHTRYKSPNQRPCLTNAMKWEIRCGFAENADIARGAYQRFEMDVNASPARDEIFIQREYTAFRVQDEGILKRDSTGTTWISEMDGSKKAVWGQRDPGTSILTSAFADVVESWQFLNLDPEKMGQPTPQKRTGRTVALNRDGSNIGDYLLNLLRQPKGKLAFESVIDTLKYVLPYARDVQPAITSEIQRTIYLQLSEEKFQVPGWLLSTGTLRILALLAVLRHPNPPPLLCIEEIENGLDPRTVRMIMEEIKYVTENGKMQVVCTTHSPTLLDMVDVESVAVVERNEDNEPKFHRYTEADLGEWATVYRTGELYLKGQLQGRTPRSAK